MEYILTTDKLTKIYGNKRAADEVCIHVKKGDVYGLIGRNGAGKTTVLKMICGLSKQTSGSFTFLGKTDKEAAPLMNKIGSLIESPGLYPKMTAFQNVKLKCLSHGIKEDEYAKSLLAQVGLENVGNKTASNFSLGMKQRLGIAIALVGEPEFLVLDEPINGLDPQGIAEMREIIHKLSKDRGMTVIVSSHILEELEKVADSFGIISDGKLIDEFTSKQLHERCGEYVSLRVSDNEKAIEILKSMNLTDYDVNEENIRINSNIEDTSVLVSKLVKDGVGVYELAQKEITLEQYYLTKTRRNSDEKSN